MFLGVRLCVTLNIFNITSIAQSLFTLEYVLNLNIMRLNESEIYRFMLGV